MKARLDSVGATSDGQLIECRCSEVGEMEGRGRMVSREREKEREGKRERAMARQKILTVFAQCCITLKTQRPRRQINIVGTAGRSRRSRWKRGQTEEPKEEWPDAFKMNVQKKEGGEGKDKGRIIKRKTIITGENLSK